jgi:hypothetical protein
MSRILNRPMFRGGGKVSSYGNGIASGLEDGYEKGGSVQPRQNLFLGGMAMSGLGYLGRGAMKYGLRPAAKYGMKGMDWLIKPKGGWSDKVINNPSHWNMLKNMGSSRAGQGIAALNPMKDSLVGGVAKVPFGAAKLVGKGVQKSPYGAAALGGDYIYNDRTYLGEGFDKAKDYITELYDNVFTGDNKKDDDVDNPDDPNSEENKRIRKEKYDKERKSEIDEIKKLYSTETKEDTEEETLAKLEKKQKLIEKVIGGGKSAKIADASDMALSYAAGALKEGATVKSSFADFFEKESARPSRSQKVKDAASNAVIQSYLTGEIDEKKFNQQMNAFMGQQKIKSLMDTAAKDDLTMAEIGGTYKTTGSTSSQAEQNADIWLSSKKHNPEGKFRNDFNSKQKDIKTLFFDKYIGEFFLDEETGEFFEIIVLPDGEIGKKRRG